MKKFISFAAVALMFVATSCGGHKAAQSDSVAEDSVEVVDTLAVDSVAADSVAVDSVVAE